MHIHKLSNLGEGVCCVYTINIHDISKSLCKVCLRQKVAHQLSTVACCTMTAGASSANTVCRVQLDRSRTTMQLSVTHTHTVCSY